MDQGQAKRDWKGRAEKRDKGDDDGWWMKEEGRKEGRVLPYVDTAVVLLGADTTAGYRGQHGHVGRSHGDVGDDQKESGCELHFWELGIGM